MTPTSSISLELPDGSTTNLHPGADNLSSTLADYLNEQGYPLNTRCGGRGLCRGCRVNCQSGSQSESLRSCQIHVKDLPDSSIRLSLPKTSWHNNSLFGVSTFDIRLPECLQRRQRDSLALALDIGTTTLAGALWDLKSGRCLAHNAIANPQRQYGDNVLSRISYSMENADGPPILQRTLIDHGLKPLFQELVRSAGIKDQSIDSANIAGNPVMLHTLLGCSLIGFGTYPFHPEFMEGRKLFSEDVGLPPGMTLELMPGLGPFVGADIVAGALAAGMAGEEGSILLIDFGTNGEILLKNRGCFYATATAAGPAFEGGRLSCGASASGRVISSLKYISSGWEYRLCDESEDEPIGVSGAAYIDFLAQALDNGLINTFGRFDRNHPEVSQHLNEDDIEYIARMSSNVWISEPDIAEILQAKAAIGAGVQVLLELAGIDATDLETVFVGGGFGYHLNPENAVRIGLLPELPLERVEIIGNSALAGASLTLQADFSEAIEALCKNCRIVELNQIPSFAEHYTDALLLDSIQR